MSQINNDDCLCQKDSTHKNVLPLLRSYVHLLRLCASEPMLYEKDDDEHDLSAKKNDIWIGILNDWSTYQSFFKRKCKDECELTGLMRKFRKYIEVIAGKQKLDKSVKNDVNTVNRSEATTLNHVFDVMVPFIELLTIHPVLYDPMHPDYNNDQETLSVWNYIGQLQGKFDDRDFEFDFDTNARIAENLLRRLAKPIIYVKKEALMPPAKKPKTGTDIVEKPTETKQSVNSTPTKQANHPKVITNTVPKSAPKQPVSSTPMIQVNQPKALANPVQKLAINTETNQTVNPAPGQPTNLVINISGNGTFYFSTNNGEVGRSME
ncbi:uncharacterized protein LOC116350413 isoform X2 [Contarinia nasturtii]|uniref:uncharacterized protein LOC116350413 isoform X2 n=1 Tax=Contarinia nasturtii TaxID=265458 RepID=UPI0012D394A2|nr:uncharacterized protein LOC116350413 isoform X2 [Contarinia nasturtii]